MHNQKEPTKCFDHRNFALLNKNIAIMLKFTDNRLVDEKGVWMPEEQKSQSQQKSSGRYHIQETKSSPPAEPVNMAPFSRRDGGLASPPIEPVNVSPFSSNPTNQVKAPIKTQKGK
jgi:hypothetical protein